jgi:type I restriction enzyme M protein
MINSRELSILYQNAHDLMRNVDGLQPQEAFDELLKYLFFKIQNEKKGPKIDDRATLLDDGTFGNDKHLSETIQIRFKEYLNSVNSWTTELWHDRKYHLSSSSLVGVHSIFKTMNFANIDIDIKSAALRSFLTPEIRRGLGIFLTPDDVVKAILNYVAPKKGDKILDPACGSGTFLIESLKYLRHKGKKGEKYEVWGVDKNPRMLMLADLNLSGHDDCIFNKKLADSLMPDEHATWLKPNYFDVILTNPPFGVILDKKHYDLSKFATCENKIKQQSEVAFVEQCLKYLKPGGTLAIVLPKSVINNEGLSEARMAINQLGYVTAIMYLPSQTFQLAGTQTTTVVLFMKKFKEGENRKSPIRIALASIANVGYDSTGRSIEGNQLTEFADNMRSVLNGEKIKGDWRLLSEIKKCESLIGLSNLIIGGEDQKSGIPLSSVIEYIGTGQTPARKNYSPEGLFLVKVGNLSGNGIDWSPRNRNFVDAVENSRRKASKRALMIQKGDILLTSSAHTPIYIAQKIDIVTAIPDHLNNEASYVGEVMLIRVKKDVIDPMALMVFLRHEETRKKIRGMVRGQTAHLHPSDMEKLIIPKSLLKPNSTIKRLIQLTKEENDLASRKNEIFFEQSKIMEELCF